MKTEHLLYVAKQLEAKLASVTKSLSDSTDMAVNAQFAPLEFPVRQAIEHLRGAAEEIDRLQANSRLAIATEKGEVWFWQGDGYDYPDTLACPVVIQPEALREFIRAREELKGIKSVE